MKKQSGTTATKVAIICGIMWSGICFGMEDKDQKYTPQAGSYAATAYQPVVDANIRAFPAGSNLNPFQEQIMQSVNAQLVNQQEQFQVAMNVLQQQVKDARLALNQINCARRNECKESDDKFTALQKQLTAQKEEIGSLSKSLVYLQGKQDGMVAGGNSQMPLVITQNSNSTAANSTAVETQNNNDTETYYKALRNEGILASMIIVAALCKGGPVGGVGAALLLAGGGCYKHKSVLSEIIRKFRVISGCFVVAVGSMGIAMLANDKDMTAACFVIAPASLFVAAIYGATT